jgi:hypothetical protein
MTANVFVMSVCGGSSDDHVACYAPYIPVRERQVSDGPKWAAPDGCCSFETGQADRRGQCRYPGAVVPYFRLAACVVILVIAGQSTGAGPAAARSFFKLPRTRLMCGRWGNEDNGEWLGSVSAGVAKIAQLTIW